VEKMNQKAAFTVALVGNPNCGKTTLFNALTGSKQRVGNWPGVTVERKMGEYTLDNLRYEIVDLPGTYSLDVVDREVSLDEKVARDYVHANEADLVINIVDASNLERNLYLTSQLVEMRLPLLVVLNMIDVAAARGIQVDTAMLSQQLGCPVVAVVASEGRGIDELKSEIHKVVKQRSLVAAEFSYSGALEDVVNQLAHQIAVMGNGLASPLAVSPRWLAVRLLEGDDLARQIVSEEINATARRLTTQIGGDLDIAIADARYSLANRVARQCVNNSGRIGRDLTDTIDRVVLHRAFGIPLFLLMMYLMFMFTINIGGAFIDFFDQFAGAIFVDGLGQLLAKMGAPDGLQVMLASGIGGGIQTVATFIPVIAFLYLFLSALEDSGYMARAAFVMDRFMRWVGLPGKSFVPLIVGFGCNVPAIMATRTLEHRRDRLMTIAMAPFMSCGARMPVYVLFAAAFFPTGGQNIVFGLYLIGIAVAIITGLILKNSIMKGDATPFIMELPPYHLPTVGGIVKHTWSRLKSFIFRAGSIIVPMVLVINFLNAVGTDGTFGNEDSDKSVLAEIGRTIAPAFSPMGLDEENWPAAVGIFTGILAKEAVVGTLDAAYTALAESDAAAAGEIVGQEAEFVLGKALIAALATIPANLADAIGTWGDPLGINLGEVNPETVAEEHEISTGIFGAMASRFDGAAGAFAYLLFILLYFPCTAAIAAVYNESGFRWTLFVGAWTTSMAYGLATLYYQAAIFSRDPLSATSWIVGIIVTFIAFFLFLRWQGSREIRMPMAVTQRA
jgi:ferrous iron transport protein B